MVNEKHSERFLKKGEVRERDPLMSYMFDLGGALGNDEQRDVLRYLLLNDDTINRGLILERMGVSEEMAPKNPGPKSHEQIRKAIMDLAEKSNDELADLSLKAHEYAKQNHSTERYRKAFGKVISQIERDKSVQ